MPTGSDAADESSNAVPDATTPASGNGADPASTQPPEPDAAAPPPATSGSSSPGPTPTTTTTNADTATTQSNPVADAAQPATGAQLASTQSSTPVQPAPTGTPTPEPPPSPQEPWWKRLATKIWKWFVGAVVLAGLVAVAMAVFNRGGEELASSLFDANVVLQVEANPDQIPNGLPGAAGDDAYLGGAYFFPSAIASVPAAPKDSISCVGRHDWAEAAGGADAGQSTVEFTVSTEQASGIRIIGVEPTIVHSDAPPAGSYVSCPGKGADRTDVHFMNLDLDQPPPGLLVLEPDGSFRAPDYQVTPGEPEVFSVTATANNCDCQWELTLRVKLDDGTEVTKVLREDNGEPFRTVSVAGAVRYEWVDGKWTRVDVGTTPPPPAFPSPPDACSLLTDSELTAAMGGLPVTRVPGLGMQYGKGATGIQEWQSICSFMAAGTDGGTALVSLVKTAGNETSRAEFDAVSRLMGGGPSGPGRPVEIPNADKATQFGDTVLILHGPLLLQVQVTPPPGTVPGPLLDAVNAALQRATA